MISIINWLARYGWLHRAFAARTRSPRESQTTTHEIINSARNRQLNWDVISNQTLSSYHTTQLRTDVNVTGRLIEMKI